MWCFKQSVAVRAVGLPCARGLPSAMAGLVGQGLAWSLLGPAWGSSLRLGQGELAVASPRLQRTGQWEPWMGLKCCHGSQRTSESGETLGTAARTSEALELCLGCLSFSIVWSIEPCVLFPGL